MSFDRKLFQRLNELWQLKKGSKYLPFPLPISMEYENLNEIKNNQKNYIVSLKSDGIRHACLLTNIDDDNCVALINRNAEITFMKQFNYKLFDDELFHGTLIDGELIYNNFIIFDVLTIDGFDVKAKPFIKNSAVRGFNKPICTAWRC